MAYQTHLFFCVNQKKPGKRCCNNAGATELCDYAKSQLKKLGLVDKMNIRVNKSGCLGRCSLGPCLVIYPEGVWYYYETQRDIDEILEKHLLNGEIVSRLLIDTIENSKPEEG